MRLLALGLIALLAAGCGDRPSGAPTAAAPATGAPARAADASPPVEEVSLANPEYKTRATTLDTTGKIAFDDEHLVRVTAPATGRVLDVLARPGEVVEPGHRLLVLDCPDLGLAKSDYAKALSDAERTDHALRLARDLFEVKAVSQREIRDAENEARKAVAERERAAWRLRTLGVPEAQLADITARPDAATRMVVTAPRSGVIVERNVSPGQVVAYGQSDTPVSLFVIADLTTMWVLADVYEPDVPRVRIGQPLSVTLPCCPSDRYEGRVTAMADAIDKETRTLKVRAMIPNPRRALKSEMFVRVRIATGDHQALVVPVGAIHREGTAPFVLVEKARDEYQRRPVRLGLEVDGTVEIFDGLTPADRVVSRGGILLKRAAP
ncbi:MAG TPA: efflux RND transporter periplasmic adaptor subunit [Methylomirabilota bacterium]|nr:efflux RND transporter periplasmic adaptor subunit [Methylomirabilota bacterium]